MQLHACLNDAVGLQCLSVDEEIDEFAIRSGRELSVREIRSTVPVSWEALESQAPRFATPSISWKP